MARAEVTIRLELGIGVHGLWCHQCLLPSAARWPLHGLTPGGVMTLGDLTTCYECDDAAARVRDAVQRVAAELGGTVMEG